MDRCHGGYICLLRLFWDWCKWCRECFCHISWIWCFETQARNPSRRCVWVFWVSVYGKPCGKDYPQRYKWSGMFCWWSRSSYVWMSMCYIVSCYMVNYCILSWDACIHNTLMCWWYDWDDNGCERIKLCDLARKIRTISVCERCGCHRCFVVALSYHFRSFCFYIIFCDSDMYSSLQEFLQAHSVWFPHTCHGYFHN